MTKSPTVSSIDTRKVLLSNTCKAMGFFFNTGYRIQEIGCGAWNTEHDMYPVDETKLACAVRKRHDLIYPDTSHVSMMDHTEHGI